MIEWAMMRDEWSFTKNDIKAGLKESLMSKNALKG